MSGGYQGTDGASAGMIYRADVQRAEQSWSELDNFINNYSCAESALDYLGAERCGNLVDEMIALKSNIELNDAQRWLALEKMLLRNAEQIAEDRERE